MWFCPDESQKIFKGFQNLDFHFSFPQFTEKETQLITSILSCTLHSWCWQLWIVSYQVFLYCPAHELQLVLSHWQSYCCCWKNMVFSGDFLAPCELCQWVASMHYTEKKKKKKGGNIICESFFPAHSSLHEQFLQKAKVSVSCLCFSLGILFISLALTSDPMKSMKHNFFTFGLWCNLGHCSLQD